VIIRTWKKKHVFWPTFHQHWYTWPIALPVRRNPQHWSLLTVVSATSVSTCTSSAKCLQHTSHCKQETFLYEYIFYSVLLHTKSHNRTLLFGSKLEHSRHFDYWNQLLNMRMRICYLDWHEAGLCCYLVIHIETYYIHYSCFTCICDLFTDSLVKEAWHMLSHCFLAYSVFLRPWRWRQNVHPKPRLTVYSSERRTLQCVHEAEVGAV
jgi:hypothetical protein